MPLMDALKNVMLNETVDIKVINLLTSFLKSIGFTDTLFVSIAGDNSNGSSWTKAYTSLKTALDWVAANQSSGETHLIMLGDGTFDMDTTGDPEYSEINLAIVGMGSGKTYLSNDHATASSILKFDSCSLTIANLTFFTGNNNINGLHLDCTRGSYLTDGAIIENVDFLAQTPTGAHSFIYLEGSVERIYVRNCNFYGFITLTTAIYTDDATYNNYTNLHIYGCLLGIHFSDADDDYNQLKNIYFHACDTCIQIDSAAANNNYFENIHFNGTLTANMDDASTTSHYHNLIVNDLRREDYYPSDLTGIPVTAGIGFNAYSAADVEIRSAVTATKPFYLLGFYYEVDTTERWGVRFTDDTSPDWLNFTLVDGTVDVMDKYYFKEPIHIKQGEAINCAVKSVTGGNDMDIWIIIKEI